MKREQSLVVMQTVAAAASVAAAAWFYPVQGEFLNRADGGALLVLAVAFVLLGYFTVMSPQGELIDTTGALSIAASSIAGPLLTAVLLIIGRLLVLVIRRQRESPWRALEYLTRRALLVSMAAILIQPALAAGTDAISAFVMVGLVCLLFFVVDSGLEQLHVCATTGASIWGTIASKLRLEGWMLAAELSVSILAVLTYPLMLWGGLVIAVGLLLVIRQSFFLLLEVQLTYRSTAEALARSIEAYDSDRRGHAERVRHLVLEAARRFGIHGRRLEDVGYAALFHDLGLLGLDAIEAASAYRSSEALSGVGFLVGAIPVLRIVDGLSEQGESLDEQDLVGAYLIAHFSARDAAETGYAQNERERAAVIGAKLYAVTRRRVDRAIRRAERDADAGVGLAPSVVAT